MRALGQSLYRSCREAGLQVRFRPKTDLILSPSPIAHVCRLCNRDEEYGHAGSSECHSRAQAGPWNKGKLTGAKPPLRPKFALGPCLKVWDLHWVDVIALNTPKLATACFDDHKVQRLAAFRADRAGGVFGHGDTR